MLWHTKFLQITGKAYSMSKRLDKSRIIAFYKKCSRKERLRLPCSLEHFTLTNTPLGLGDTIILTHLPRIASKFRRQASVYIPNSYFETVMRFNPYHTSYISPFWVAADKLKYYYDLGNGHFIQRLQRAFGFEPELAPHGCLVVPDISTQAGWVVLHFEPGPHVNWQRTYVHQRARQVYPENMLVLQEFITRHPNLRFAEVGFRFSGLEGVENWTGLDLEETIRRIARCEYFIGIMSGPLHIAAALGLKIITIINFPHPTMICLPTIKDIDVVESEWFYPQSVLLHQEGEGEFVQNFSSQNLERAFDGELYPYWSDAYLSLIYEKF